MGAGGADPRSKDDARYCLGPLVVDNDGRVRAEAGKPTRFSMHWRGRDTAACLHADGRLDLVAAVARVPSSVTAAKPDVRRPDAFAALRTLPPLLPSAWRIVLRPDHRVLIEAERQIAVPIAAEELLTELTMFLLELDPYLPLFEGEGLHGRMARPARPASEMCPRQAASVTL